MKHGKTRLAVALQLMLAAYGTSVIASESSSVITSPEDQPFEIHNKENEYFNIRFSMASAMSEARVGEMVRYSFVIQDKNMEDVEGLPVTINSNRSEKVVKLSPERHKLEESKNITVVTDRNGSGYFYARYNPKNIGEYADLFVSVPSVTRLSHVDNIKIIEHFHTVSGDETDIPIVEVTTTAEDVADVRQGDLVKIDFILTDTKDGNPMPNLEVKGYFLEHGATFYPDNKDYTRVTTDDDGKGSFYIDTKNVSVGTSIDYEMQADPEGRANWTAVKGILVRPQREQEAGS